MVEQNPHRHRLKLELVRELARQGDGLLFEKALLETLRFLPRWPPAWHLLSEWYAAQRRPDLAAAALERAGRLAEPGRAGGLAPAKPGCPRSGPKRAPPAGAFRLGRQERRGGGGCGASRRLPRLPAGPRQVVWRAFLIAARPLELPPDKAAAALAALAAELGGRARRRPKVQPLLEVLRGELEESAFEVRSALGRYERILREVPSLGLAWQRLGHLLEGRGENEAALEAYRRRLDLRSRRSASRSKAWRGSNAVSATRKASCGPARVSAGCSPTPSLPLEKLALAVLEYRGLAEDALAAIEERRALHEPSDLAALRARVRAEAGDFVGAEEELLRRPEAREAQPLHATIAELLAAEARADEVQAPRC